MSAEAIIITLLITAICAVLVLTLANKKNPPASMAVGGAESALKAEGSTRRAFGWVLIAFGLALMLYYTALYQTSVETPPVGYIGKSLEVENIGLLNNRQTGVSFGGYLFIGGCVLACFPGLRRRGEE